MENETKLTDETANNDKANVSLSLAFLFAKWIGEKKYSKHQCNDRWYDPDLDYAYLGSTEDLWKMFETDVDWHEFKKANAS